jgi:hypothetical protein
VVVNIRVRVTSESVVGDMEIQHQRHRTRRIREVTSQLNVPTSLTPALNHLLRFYFVGGAKEVSNLINRPVVSLFGSGMGSTGADMITKHIAHRLSATTTPRELGYVHRQVAKKDCQRLADQASSR